MISCSFGVVPRPSSPLWTKIDAAAHRRERKAAIPEAMRWKRILNEVARAHFIEVGVLTGYDNHRNRKYVAARFEAAWRLYAETTMSFPEIARHMGGRDHSTIVYAIDRYREMHGIQDLPEHRKLTAKKRTRVGPKKRKRAA